jgi:hypothetical protein
VTVLGFVCEDECPVHSGVHCRLERGHVQAHKARLTMKLSDSLRQYQRSCGWMEIEWRRAPAAVEV